MTDRLELPLRYRRELEALLREHVPDTEVWAYGSRVTGESHPASDLDLVLRGPSLEPLSHGFTDLLEALEDSNIPILVQAHDWARLPQSFHREFERDYVVIAERDDRATTRDWLRTTLGEVITLQRGFDLPKSKRIDGPFPVIASTGPVGTHEEAKVKGPGVVIGRSGSLGGGQYIESSFWPLNTTLWVKDFKGNDHRFCYYLLRSLDLAQFNVGSGVPTLNRNHVHPLPVFLPPLPEQRAIAHVLGTLDDKIELNRRINETLEAMARALFKSWFVDFDPVRAKMEGCDTGLPPDIADLFPDRLVPSELGEIPEGWGVKGLGDVIELSYGKALREQDRRQGSVPVYGSNGLIGWHDEKLTDGPGIIVGRKGNPGLVRWSPVDFYAIDTTFYVKPKRSKLSLRFLFHALERQDLPAIAADSAVPGLNRNLAYMNSQIVPPYRTMEQFDEQVSATFTRSHRLEQESRTLAAQRDALLPKLISGQIRVANIADALSGPN